MSRVFAGEKGKNDMQTYEARISIPAAGEGGIPMYQNRAARRSRGALFQATLKGEALAKWKAGRLSLSYAADLEGAIAVGRGEQAEKRRQKRLEMPARAAERRARREGLTA